MLKKRAASFWLNAMFYTMLQRISLFIFGVFGYMILVRGFSTTTNGVWALYITLFSLFEAVKQGLLRNVTIKFLAQKDYKEKSQAIQSTSIFINTIFSLVIVSVVFSLDDQIAAWLKAPSLQTLLIASSANVLLLIPFNHCEILLQFRYRFDSLFRAAFIRQGFFFTGLMFLYFFFPERFTLINVLLIQIFALLAALIYIYKQAREMVFGRFIYDAELTMKFFHFGKYTFGTNLFSGLSRSFDHFITAATLGAIEGKNYVAFYNTVARINNMVDVPSLAAADVLYPKNVEALENEGIEKVKYYFEQVTGTIIAFIVPLSLFIFIFPKFIIYIIAGPDYYPAIVLLQLTILFSMVRPLSYQFGSTLDAIGKPSINFTANVLLMILNLVLTTLFLKIYGGIGAAYATMIYYCLSMIVMLIILKKYIKIEAGNILKYSLKRYTDLFKLKF
ncbi:MAG TPA: polysaccharide biosynthesis C-terminal domain-containing protein [Flavitalea sp.]|nr:polysaccharide biosynthesis C-terminal domain-containing protein [Flavitalea sp.]